MQDQSRGDILAATLRQTFGIGTRTRRYGKIFGQRADLHVSMIEAIENATQLPGYYGPEKTAVLCTAWGAALSYRKHVGGYRIDGLLAQHINGLSAYQFAGLIGRMVDANVNNTGDGERFFVSMAREIRPKELPAMTTPITCPDKSDHLAGTIGCPSTVADCQGIPAPAHGVDTAQLPAPCEAEPGVYSVIRTVGNRLARVADVTGEPFHGTSNPYGRPAVRDFSVWEYAVNGRVVEVITYESRGPLDRDARHYAAVFVSGRLVEGAEALDMSRGPAGLAAEIAWRTARYLADTVDQVDTDDAPAETPADTDAPADLVDDAPAETDTDAYRPAGVPVVTPLPADWDGAPAEWYSTAQVAKLIRAAVKSYFPGVKFSVRSDSYAGGSSIRVAWTDGPTSDQVDKVTGQYAGAGFDGMADIKTYRGDVLVIGADGSRTAVRLGVDYVQTSRTESPELLDAMRPAASVMAGRELSADPTADNFPEGLADTLGVWPLGGDGRELLRFLARTRTADMRGSRDPRPACTAPGPFGRTCTLAAGHVFPLVHRDGNRDVFIAPAAEAPADAPATVDQVDAPAGFVSVHAAHHGGPALPACGLSLPVPADHGMMRAPADLQAGTTTGGPRVPFIDLVTCGGCREALTSGVTRPRCSRAVPAPEAWGGIGACNAPADQVGTYTHASFTDSWCAEHADSDPRTFNGPTWAPLSSVVLAAPVEAPHPLPVEPPAPAAIAAPAVHRFASTGEAYDASQTRDDIRDGDVLIVESERVAGFLRAAWPTTVTAESGEFHTAEGDPAEVEEGRYALSVERARAIAATWDDGDQGNGGTPAPDGPDDDDTGAALTPAEVDAVRADVAAYRSDAPAEVPADASATVGPVDDVTPAPADGGPWRLRTLPPGGNPSNREEWRDGETFPDRDAAMLAAVRLSESHHAHGVEVRGGAGRASDTVATWHAGTNVWQEWGRYGVDYGPGAEWVDRARATYAAEVAAIVAAAANRDDPHSWQVIVFEASTHRATHTGESFESSRPASRHADRISHRPFNYTAFAYLVRVHAAATAVYRDADLEPVVIPHEATPATIRTSDSVPAAVDQDAAPAVTVSFDCPAHGAVPVPVDIDGPLARSIRQEHQACTAGDPFGMAACERESTPAAHFARTLVAAGWTREEAASATAPTQGAGPDTDVPALPAGAARWFTPDTGGAPREGDAVRVAGMHDRAGNVVTDVVIVVEKATRLNGCTCYRLTAARPGPADGGRSAKVDILTGCGFHPDERTLRVAASAAELEAARALGAEAHGFGAEQSTPHDDPEFTALVATLPRHISARPLVAAYHRGYAETAEAAAYETAWNLENNAVALAEARKVAERNAAAQWAVESTEAARASLARTLEKRTAQAEAARVAETAAEAPAATVEGDDQEAAPDVYTLPLEAYTPVVKSDQGGDLVITHDHEDGTVLHGSRRGDGVWDITRNHGFECRRGVMFIRNTRDRFARLHTIDQAAEALRAAGWTVAVEVDDVWRPAAVREEVRAERASARAERLSDRACRQYGESNARREAARAIGDMLPFGEPIKIGHHSEARHRRAFDRIDAHTRASIAAWDYAQNLASRAAGAVANEAHKHDPGAIMRRIERLEAERRQWERSLADAVANNAPGQARRSMLEAEKIAEDVAYQRAKLGDMAETGVFVAWSREHFRPGDWAKVAGRWCEVVRVNAKSVSVRNRYGFGASDRAQPAPWDEIGGRRRDGLQWDTVNGEPWPIEQAQRVAKWRDLVRSLSVGCDRDDQDEARRRRHTGYARRLVLGLGRDATPQEVDAYGEPDTVEGRRARALACMDVWDRLEAGETFDQVAADTAPLADTAPAWTMPDGEPVDVRPRDLVPGDIVAGVYDRFFSGERLIRSIVGPVTAPTTERDRHESGEWATVTVDGVAHEMKAWRQLSAYLVGPRPAPVE